MSEIAKHPGQPRAPGRRPLPRGPLAITEFAEAKTVVHAKPPFQA